MAFNQAAMAAFADYAVANCNGRYQDLAGRDLNVDGRYGYQCMDLWIWARYRLGFMDTLPTPDAAAVWELNNQPGLRLWEFFDAITPDQPAMSGDFFVMNRNFYGNGVGHIGMVLADLGGSFRALELNGLGDGFEDNAGGQYGSPGRIHEWPKTHLYGYLRWIGPAPIVTAQANTITPIIPKEDTLSAAEVDKIMNAIGEKAKEVKEHLNAHMLYGTNSTKGWMPGATDMIRENQRRINTANANIAALTEALNQLAKSKGVSIDYAKIGAVVAKALADGIDVTGEITVGGKK